MLVFTAACVPAIPRSPTIMPVAHSVNAWRVEPGDVIKIRNFSYIDVQATNEHTNELLVNERGLLNIPLVGRIQVQGMTPDAVVSTIIRAYAERVDSARIDVLFLRPISVVGGVKSAGVQLADPSATVLSLVARVGGATRPGGDVHVYLLRAGEPTREVSLSDRVSNLNVRAEDQLYVEDPPFVARNEAVIRASFELLSFLTGLVALYLAVRSTRN